MKAESNKIGRTPVEHLSADERKRIIGEFVDIAANRLRSRTEEVLEEPEYYGGNDLHELRWQVCAAIVDDLNHDLGDEFEEMLEDALLHGAERKTLSM